MVPPYYIFSREVIVYISGSLNILWLPAYIGYCPDNDSSSLIPRLLCGGGGKRAWYTCSCMRQVSLVTCILLCYTKINGNVCLPAEGHTAELILPVRHLRVVLKTNCSDVNCLHHFVQDNR